MNGFCPATSPKVQERSRLAKRVLIWEQEIRMILFQAKDLRNLIQGRAYELW